MKSVISIQELGHLNRTPKTKPCSGADLPLGGGDSQKRRKGPQRDSGIFEKYFFEFFYHNPIYIMKFESISEEIYVSKLHFLKSPIIL